MPNSRNHLKPTLQQILVTVILAVALTACNLQMQQDVPTSSALETNTPSEPPTNAPAQQATLGPTLPPPPVTTNGAPTPLPLQLTTTTTGVPNPSGLPTVNAAEADQRYELQARAGKTIGVNYNVTATGGSVTITLQGPEGVLWQKTFTTSEVGRAEAVAQQGGTYEIVSKADRLEGNYELSWD